MPDVAPAVLRRLQMTDGAAVDRVCFASHVSSAALAGAATVTVRVAVRALPAASRAVTRTRNSPAWRGIARCTRLGRRWPGYGPMPPGWCRMIRRGPRPLLLHLVLLLLF